MYTSNAAEERPSKINNYEELRDTTYHGIFVVEEGWKEVIDSVPRIGEFTEDLSRWSSYNIL